MKQKIKLGSIVIGVKDIEKAKEFYVNVFGVKIDTQSENYLGTYLNEIRIEIEEDSENRFPNWVKNNIGTHKSCEFIVTDMKFFLDSVLSHGGKVVSEPIERPWGSITAEIADLDGNTFLISQEI